MILVARTQINSGSMGVFTVMIDIHFQMTADALWDKRRLYDWWVLQIKVVNGVILVAWQQKILERQIDYGAKLGHVVLSLAKMELANFYKNVMPVADYFDQRGMLITVVKTFRFWVF